jgi:hypothetical protein
MQAVRVASTALAIAALSGVGAAANIGAKTMKFVVMRDGTQIGTNSISFDSDATGTKVQTVTHVSVGFGFLTLYHFDQTETEEWSGGRLMAMNSTTDDNGTLHRASATARDGKIVVQADNEVRELAPTTIPLNLWNPALMVQKSVLDPKDGSVKPIKVIDRGEDDLAVQGKTQRAHHYQIVTSYQQDVWYDDNHQLVQVELKGTDGSTIRYQLM